MGLALNDVPLRTRRVGGQVHVYPGLLRDGSVLPRIALAIEYFESLVGQERQHLEPEVLLELFGEPRLTRGLIGALEHWYRFQPRRIDDVVGQVRAARLARAGLGSPPLLRLWLYDRLNATSDGFLRSSLRPELWPELESELKLRPGHLEQVLYLDRPEYMRLERVGSRPLPADVRARYNVLVVECLLRHAESIELMVGGLPDAPAEACLALCRAQDVDASFDAATGRLRLVGRQDALGGWSRHGRHLAGACLQLVERGRGLLTEVVAQVAVRGRRGRLRLQPEVLDLLGGPAGSSAVWEPDDVPNLVRTCSTTLRSWGWRVRVLPDPQPSAQGVVLPDLLVQWSPGAAEQYLVGVRGPHHARRLARQARMATTLGGLVGVGWAGDLHELRAAGIPVVVVPGTPDRPPSRLELAGCLRDQLGARPAQAA